MRSTGNLSSLDNSCRMCSLNLDQHGVSLRLNLSMYGGALADPEYVRMVAPQFEPRKRKSQTCAFVFEHRSKLTHALLQTGEVYCGCLALFWEYSFPGKVGSDLCEENPIYLDKMDHSVRPS